MTNSNPASSGIVHLQLNGTETLTSSPQIDIRQTTKGIDIDSAGNIWVASGGDDHIYLFDSAGNFLGGFQGGGIGGPRASPSTATTTSGSPTSAPSNPAATSTAASPN